MIKIENAIKIYNPEKTKPVKALNNINLEFNKEECLILLNLMINKHIYLI